MNSNKVFIYGLTGDDNIIRYVGKTPSRRLNKRKHEHLSEARSLRDNRHKNNWIRKILNKDENLNIIVLEECNEDNWIEREIFWISQFENLTNRSEGGEGNSGYEYKLNLEEVMKWVKTNIPEVNSESKWRKYKKKNNLPDFIPNRPDARYKNDGWISFTHFFNYVDHSKRKNFITYDDLKKTVIENKIKTLKQYKNFRKENMPSNPNLFYKEWKSCRDFFGEIKANKEIKNKRNIVLYEDAKSTIKSLNFTKKVEYTKWYEENKNLCLPRNPPVYYKDEWISWNDFFGNNLPKIINYYKKQKSTLFLSYSNAKEWIKNNISNLKIENDWRKITKTLPKFIPKRPDYVYKNSGWKNYAEFLS